MGFWNSIAAMADGNADDDGADNLRWTAEVSSLDEVAEKAKSDTLDILVNLPTGKIESRHNACETCGRVAILGNGLCMKCWDYVVDNSSANSKLWPDANQYREIKAKKG
jgi:hypothetical protein